MESLEAFVQRVSPRLLEMPHMRGLVDSFERGAREQGAVAEAHSMPVRAGTTTLALHFMAWLLRERPSRKVLYLTHSTAVAQRNVEESQLLYLEGGGCIGILRNGRHWCTEADGLCYGTGVGGQLAPLGFTDIVCDDLHKNREEAESRTIREGVCDFVFNDALTRRDPHGTNVWILGSRWHPDDIIGTAARVMALHNVPALDENDESNIPSVLSTELLIRLRRAVGQKVFAGLYQGVPPEA